jgi:hypothetical protein
MAWNIEPRAHVAQNRRHDLPRSRDDGDAERHVDKKYCAPAEPGQIERDHNAAECEAGRTGEAQHDAVDAEGAANQFRSGLCEPAPLLTRLNVPQPATDIVRSANEFAKSRSYPYFLKAAFGTASALRPCSMAGVSSLATSSVKWSKDLAAATCSSSASAVAAYSLTPAAIHRLRAWPHSA